MVFPSCKIPHGYKTRHQDAKHDKQLHDYIDGSHNELLRRSLLGLPKVYNSLEQKIVDAPSVRIFQRRLQKKVVNEIRNGSDNWQYTLNLRKVSFIA